MLFKHLIELYELLDSPQASGAIVADYLKAIDPECTVETYPLEGPKGITDMVRVRIPGAHGKSSGRRRADHRSARPLGRFGSTSRTHRIRIRRRWRTHRARLRRKAARHAQERRRSTWRRIREHACVPACAHHAAQTRAVHGLCPRPPRPSMPKRSHPSSMPFLVVDTTKGNRIANNRGFAISPTVKQGVVMRVSEDLLGIAEIATASCHRCSRFQRSISRPMATACTT